jgi:PEP-CTERM motif
LTGGGNAFDLDFGSVLQGSPTPQALLAFLNNNPLADQAFTDLLSSSGVVLSGSGFTFTGASFGGLAGGAIQGGFDIGFDTSNLGNFTEILSFDIESSNSGGYDQIIGAVTLTLDGNVVSSTPTVPEPGTLSLLVSGVGAVFFVVRRRRRA